MSNKSQPFAGFTSEQIAFLRSKPWIKSVHIAPPPSRKPYIPGVVVVSLLNAGFGYDGWSTEIVSLEAVPLSPTTYDGETTYRYGHKAVLRLLLSLRGPTGELVYGAPPMVRVGVSYHEGKCKSQAGIGSAIKSGTEGVITKSIRNAAITLGPVFGLKVMRALKDSTGKTIDWKAFTSDEHPPFPNLPGVDVFGTDPGGLDTSKYDPSQLEAGGVDPDDVPDLTPTEKATEKATASGFNEKPSWMTVEDWAEVNRYGLPKYNDRKPYMVTWTNTDGSTAARFSGDPIKSCNGLVSRGAKSVNSVVRRPDAVESGEMRLASQGAPATDRKEIIAECRHMFRKVDRDTFHNLCSSVAGRTPDLIGRPEAQGGVSTSTLQELIDALKVTVTGG